MAYRRRQYQQQQTTTSSATTRVSSVSTSDNDDFQLGGDNEGFGHDADVSGGSSTSLAARAIKASSAARRDSSLSSAYGFNQRSPAVAAATTADYSSFSGSKQGITGSSYSSNMDSKSYEYTSMKNLNESKQGFWGALARKAKSILEDDDSPQQVDSPRRTMQNAPQASAKLKYQNPYSDESQQKTEQPALQKGLNAISSSLNYFGNAVEEGLTVMENRTAGIIQETRKHIRKKPGSAATQNQATNRNNMWQAQTQAQPQTQTDLELQLKASRDVAMAMAAKAKLLLRELKTVKADLAFAKERCGQLEEENRVLRETRDRGEDPEDDDLVRLQLETLLAEKARLAHENSVYARENRFLREVVEYHQLTMQDVVYLDEGTEEVTEVYPIKVVSNSHSPAPLDKTLGATQDIPPHPVPPPGLFS